MSEKSHGTGHMVRSKLGEHKSNKEYVVSVVHFTVQTIEAGKAVRTACRRTGVVVGPDKQQNVFMSMEEKKAEKVLRVSQYRTLVTCKRCN